MINEDLIEPVTEAIQWNRAIVLVIKHLVTEKVRIFVNFRQMSQSRKISNPSFR